MAGIEAVGLVLGGFSLIISAIEHYQTIEKLGKAFWKLRRQHREDNGRLEDCRLDYRMHMRQLLQPLVVEGRIEQAELELLVENLSSKGWINPEIDERLGQRLGERKKRYFENLNEMHDALKKLGRISRVDDEHFQMSLRRRDEDGVRTTTASTDVSHNLMIRANDNMRFELKRVTYTLQKFKRDDIVKDIGRINTLLRNTLADQDSISQEDDFALGLTRRTVPRQYKKLLRFWRHADCIYRLMQSAWRCTCAPLHCVYLHLDQCNVRKDIGLDMLVNFCHSGASQEPRPWDTFSLSVTCSEAQQPQQLSPLQSSRPL